MTTTLEKAARAAWSSYPNDDASFDGLTEVQKDTAYKQARAVLLSMTEVDPEIRDLLFTSMGNGFEIWHEAIDAILAQPSEGEG